MDLSLSLSVGLMALVGLSIAVVSVIPMLRGDPRVRARWAQKRCVGIAVCGVAPVLFAAAMLLLNGVIAFMLMGIAVGMTVFGAHWAVTPESSGQV
jgi:hypothetical protein